MTEYPVALIGGPRDGEFWVIPEDLSVLRLAQMGYGASMFAPETSPPEAMPMLEVQYYRSKRIDDTGHRLYFYEGLKVR